jgi:hypothetical protein
MHARLRAALGRCGRGGRGWSTPRRTAVRRTCRSGILQSRMNAAPGKARRTLLQNDAAAPRWAAGLVARRCRRRRRRAAWAARAAIWHQAHWTCHIRPTGIPHPARTSSVILSEAPRRTVRHTKLRRRPKNPAPPHPMHARLRAALGRCGRGGRGWSTPRRTAARRTCRSGILQSRMDPAPGKARRTLLQNDASAPRRAAGHRWSGGTPRGGVP